MDITVYIGAYLEVPKVAVESDKCSNRSCGAKLKRSHKYCPECGTQANSGGSQSTEYPDPDTMPEGLGDNLTVYGGEGSGWVDKNYSFGFNLRNLETDSEMALDFEKFAERVRSAKAHYQPLVDAFFKMHGVPLQVRFGEIHHWG